MSIVKKTQDIAGLKLDHNKANWSAALNAAIVLINGRLPDDIALTANEQGLLMIVLTYLVVRFLPNAAVKQS